MPFTKKSPTGEFRSVNIQAQIEPSLGRAMVKLQRKRQKEGRVSTVSDIIRQLVVKECENERLVRAGKY